jgi:mannitol/fructose-specific phosphotransferase system IIA component
MDNQLTTTTKGIQQDAEWGDAKTVHRIFGISRTPLYRLIASGLIKSVSLQLQGSERGKRLFHLQSISDLLESRATGGRPQA